MTSPIGELPIFLLLGTILLVSLLFRRLAGVVGQPQVVGEILAGLVIGFVLATMDQKLGSQASATSPPLWRSTTAGAGRSSRRLARGRRCSASASACSGYSREARKRRRSAGSA